MSFTESQLPSIIDENRNGLLSTAGHWTRVRLGDIASILNGFAFKSTHFNDENGLPIIRIRNVVAGHSDTYYSGPYEKAYIVNRGDLLVGMDGDFQCANWQGESALLNQRVCKLSPDSPYYESRFLRHVLPGYLNAINEHTSAITVKHLSSRTLANIPLPLPPLLEQRAIVAKIDSLFSELDKGVEQLQALATQLKRYRQAILKAAFDGKLTADWRARQQAAGALPAAEVLLGQIQAQRIALYEQQLVDWNQAVQVREAAGVKSSGQGSLKKPRKPSKPKDLRPLTVKELADLPDLPMGWGWVRLDCLGVLARGKSRHRPRNAEHLYGGPYPYVQTGEIKAANRIIKTYTQTYSEAGLAQSRLWPANTLCITIAANIAETAFLGFDGCFPDSVVGFTAYEAITVPEYIELFLGSAKQRISAFAPATAQKNINLSTLENLIVPYCTRVEQEAICSDLDARFSVIDDLERAVESGAKQAVALRQSILKKAVEGRLLSEAELATVRADQAYEPAEVLIERIRAEHNRSGMEAKGGRKIDKTRTFGRPKVSGAERYRQAAYAAYAVKRLATLETFGRVQQMKLVYLIPHALAQESQVHARREAAGPLDPAIHKIEGLAKRMNWFTTRKVGRRYIYRPGPKIDEAVEFATEKFGDKSGRVDWLLGQFAMMDTEQAELVATTFAVWNDHLIDGHEPSNDEIVAGVHGWHLEKVAKFAPNRIVKCIQWMM